MKKVIILGLSLAAIGAAAHAQTIAHDQTQPAKGAFTVGQIEDADVLDTTGREVGDVEHVLLDAAGKPTAVVVEVDRPGADKRVVVALADLTVTPEPGDADDIIVRSKLTRAQLAALPQWKG